MGIIYRRKELANLDIGKEKNKNKSSINSAIVQTARIGHNIQTGGGTF